MIGRALTSVFWGMVADRYGRKPVILFGIVTVLVAEHLYLEAMHLGIEFHLPQVSNTTFASIFCLCW